jgi:putative transposase
MIMRMRRSRLATFSYIGFHRYSLTFCTIAGQQVFTSWTVVTPTLSQILRVAEREGFAVLAYCFMPDHLHLLVEGRRDDANLRRFVHVGSTEFAIQEILSF